MNYDMTDKELAEHIYKEYGDVYRKEDLRSFAYFISMLLETTKDYDKTYARAYINGAITGMRHAAFFGLNNNSIDDINEKSFCFDRLSGASYFNALETGVKILKDKNIFPDELRSNKQGTEEEVH